MAGVFKAYDVRGVFPSQIDGNVAYRIGRAFVRFSKAKKVIVGGDARASTPVLMREFIRGVCDEGCDVVDIGTCSTDMGYFASWKLKLSGALVTASHNPWEYNGIKMFLKNAAPIGEDSGLREIEKISQSLPKDTAKRKGKVEKKDMVDGFVDFALSFIDVSKVKPLRVAVDTQFGAGGLIAKKLFSRLPCRVVYVNARVGPADGACAPNPMLEQARAGIVQAMLEKKCEMGIALDGDCDRCFFLDASTQVIAGDFVTGILGRRMAVRYAKSPVVYDVRASWFVPEFVAQVGGSSVKTRVGHVFIKQLMKKVGARFAGEVSGHYYYRKGAMFFDSGWISALMMLEFLSSEGKSLAQALEPAKGYFISGEINSSVNDKDKVLRAVEKVFGGRKGCVIDRLDGLSVECAQWKFNVRASNTEPLLRLNVEGRTRKVMEQVRDELLALVRA